MLTKSKMSLFVGYIYTYSTLDRAIDAKNHLFK